MSCLACRTGSAPVGQAFTHAGSRPAPTPGRCTSCTCRPSWWRYRSEGCRTGSRPRSTGNRCTSSWLKSTMPFVVLDDGPRRRTGQKAARFVAVEAGVLADQPGEGTIGEVDLVEPHQVPGVGGQILMALVAAEDEGLLDLEIVPFLAGDLAGLAPDAQVDIDQLRQSRRVSRRMLVPEEGVADCRLIGQSEFGGMPASSGPLDVDEEALELGRADVAVADIGGEQVGHLGAVLRPHRYRRRSASGPGSPPDRRPCRRRAAAAASVW